MNTPTAAPMPNAAGQGQQIQLHDIHLPEQVSNLPIAPGWWILLLAIILLTVWLIKNRLKNKKLNASKNKALLMLSSNEDMSAKDSISLLKWAAMQYFSRQQLAKLYGDSFQQFLIEHLPVKHQARFTELTNAAFKGQYQKSSSGISSGIKEEDETSSALNIDLDCHQAAKLWVTYALPVDITIKSHGKQEANR